MLNYQRVIDGNSRFGPIPLPYPHLGLQTSPSSRALHQRGPGHRPPFEPGAVATGIDSRKHIENTTFSQMRNVYFFQGMVIPANHCLYLTKFNYNRII